MLLMSLSKNLFNSTNSAKKRDFTPLYDEVQLLLRIKTLEEEKDSLVTALRIYIV